MTEAEKERAAVVEWLRGQADLTDWVCEIATLGWAADSIKRNDHLKEQADG